MLLLCLCILPLPLLHHFQSEFLLVKTVCEHLGLHLGWDRLKSILEPALQRNLHLVLPTIKQNLCEAVQGIVACLIELAIRTKFVHCCLFAVSLTFLESSHELLGCHKLAVAAVVGLDLGALT